MSKLVVKQHRPLRIVFLVAVVSLIISSLVWIFLDQSHWTLIQSRTLGAGETKSLWDENKELRTENQKLKDKLLRIERTAEIDQLTNQKMRQQLEKVQQQYHKAVSELDFYEGIMESTRTTKGINIQGLYLNQSDSNPLRYRYRLVMTNVAKGDKRVEGRVELTVSGEQDSVKERINFKDIADNTEKNYQFSFKNFNKIDGYITLPEGFNPNRVTVQLNLSKPAQKQLKQGFEWHSLSSW